MTDLCVIGDVHGEVKLLERLLQLIPKDTHIVFVGDLVNRGEHSREVIALVAELVREGSATAVMGNHELALLRYLEDGDFLALAKHDGAASIRSYVGRARPDVHKHFRESFPSSHESFLRSLAPCFETDEVLVTHAGLDPSRPGDRDVGALTSGDRAERMTPLAHDKLVVFGHFPQRHVIRRGQAICVDTGCGYGGPLSCLLWPSLDVLSAGRV